MSERATPRKSGGKYDVDAVTLLANKVDALAQRLDRVGTFPLLEGSSGSSIGVYAACGTCGVQGHTFVECYNGPCTIEHANVVHNFNPPPQNNPCRNTHCLGWKSYSNPLTGTLTLNLRMLYSHLGSSAEPPTPLHHRRLYNLNQTWRVSWSNSYKSNLESLIEQFI